MGKANINLEGVELEVEYDFHPYEKETRTNPEVPKSLDVTNVFYKGLDVTEIYESMDKLTAIEEKVKES